MKRSPDSDHLLVVAAEASGDRHAARLVRAVRDRWPSCGFSGFGGPELAAAGCRVEGDLTAMSSMVVGFLGHVGAYVGVLRRFERMLVERRPRAVVLVDSPGLNFLLARLARWRGVPVVYYICPQIWAWAPWRRRKVLKWCDLLLAILPFEEELYGGGPVPVHYVGHPLGDEMAEVSPAAGDDLRRRLGIGASEKVLGLFPGSRHAEVHGLMPVFSRLLVAMELGSTPVRLVASSYRPEFVDAIREPVRAAGFEVDVVEEDARAVMASCDLALAASGTATLELAYLAKPMVVLYRTTRWGLRFYRWFSVSPWIALPNILGCRLRTEGAVDPVVPERLFATDVGADVAPIARRLLHGGEERDAAIARLRRLRETALAPGGVERAAAALTAFLHQA